MPTERRRPSGRGPATILLSSHFGYPLSTTHVVTGSVLGSGLGKPGAEVRWGVAGRMDTAWLLTLPAAGGVGAGVYLIVHGIGGFAGATTGFLLLVAIAAAIWLRSRKSPVDNNNVNDDWEGNDSTGTDKPSANDTRSEAAAASQPHIPITPMPAARPGCCASSRQRRRTSSPTESRSSRRRRHSGTAVAPTTPASSKW
jgi:inorganic phosphate transporter, PiT family